MSDENERVTERTKKRLDVLEAELKRVTEAVRVILLALKEVEEEHLDECVVKEGEYLGIKFE